MALNPGTGRLAALATTPNAPPPGYAIFYFKTDNVLYIQDSAGVETPIGTASGITSLTGDVTGTGPGVTSSVVAFVGGKTASEIATSVNATLAATSLNTNGTLVLRDASGNFSANIITASLVGAASANVLKSGDTMTGPLNVNSSAGNALIVDTDVLVVDGALNRVGINKVNPNEALEVVGNIKASGTLTGTNISGINTGDVAVTDTNTIDLSLSGQNLTADVKLSNATIVSDVNGIKVGTVPSANVSGLATVATTGAYSDLSGTPSSLPPSGSAGGDLSGSYPNPTLSSAKQNFLLDRANHTGTQTASTISDFNETAQDAVGNILTDTTTIDFTYDDAGNTISADVKPSSISDSLLTSGINANKIGSGVVDNTEFSYLDGVTSSIQTQINSITGSGITSLTGDVTATGPGASVATIASGVIDNNKVSNTAAISRSKLATGTNYRIVANNSSGVMSENSAITASRAVTSDANGQLVASTTSTTELNYVTGVTSPIQTQINNLIPSTPTNNLLVWVMADGNDGTGNGTYERPYLTIAYALSTITDASIVKRYTVMVGPKNLAEPVFNLKPYVWIRGIDRGATRIQVTGGNIGLDPSWATTTARCGLTNILISGSNNQLNFDLQAIGGGGLSCVIELATVHVNGAFTFKARSSADVIEVWQIQALSSFNISGGNALVQNSYLSGNVTVNNAGVSDSSSIDFTRNNISGNVSFSAVTNTINANYLANAMQGTINFNGSTMVANVDVLAKGLTVTGGANVTLLTTADTLKYTPTTPSNWSVAPTTTQEGLDTLASNVGGISVAAHASRHLPSGADPITTAAPLLNLDSTTTNAVGTANSLARSDHSHAISTGVVSTIIPDQSNSAGSSANLAKADHIHNIPSGTPVQIGTSNFIGAASSFALSDHVHAHGNQTSGTLHAVATISVNGFMSSTDKTKLDASTNLNTASAIVQRDASGNFSAGTITANLTGNASGSAGSFTGSLLGDITGTQTATVVSLVGGKTSTQISTSVDDTIAATSSNIASTIVKRSSSSLIELTTGQLNGSVSGNVKLQAADTTTTYTVKYPNAQGAAGTYLSNDGSGNLTWTSPLVNIDGGRPDSVFVLGANIVGGTP